MERLNDLVKARVEVKSGASVRRAFPQSLQSQILMQIVVDFEARLELEGERRRVLELRLAKLETSHVR